MNPIPYKSGPAAMTDLIGGQVNMFSADFGVTVPQHKAGKIRGLAVTSTKRSAAVPELPTVNEALGLKDYELIAYFAVFAPAGTPPDRDCQAQRGHQRRGGRARICRTSSPPPAFAIDPGTPEALAQRNKAETAKWEKAIRDAKIEQHGRCHLDCGTELDQERPRTTRPRDAPDQKRQPVALWHEGLQGLPAKSMVVAC
jgi:tripartite-type tricarboxylate transporter receptor subunit TctC